MNRLAFFALFPTLLLPLACDHRSDPPVAMPSQLVENRAPYDPAKRRSAKLRQHGLTPEMFDAMLSQQNGVCAICGAASSGRWGTLAVDHDHETGRVRGLLCSRCNTAIGLFGDDPARMDEAAAYLRAHLPQADTHRRKRHG